MTEQEIRKFVRQILNEEGIEMLPQMGAELQGTPDAGGEDKEKKVLEQNRKDEIINTIRKIFFHIKNNQEIITRYRKLYQQLHTNNEESQATFFTRLFDMIRDKFLFLLRMIPRDVEAVKLFEKETMPIVNEELEKAYINLKDRITS